MCPEISEMYDKVGNLLRDYFKLVAEHQVLNESDQSITDYYIYDAVVGVCLRPITNLGNEGDVYITEGFPRNIPEYRINDLLEYSKLTERS